jgi:hypothetical protein
MEKKKMFLIMVLLLSLASAIPVHAATKSSTKSQASVSTVKSKWKYYKKNNRYYQSAVIYGKTKSGKTVWKYKTSRCLATELDSASWKVKGNSVYIIDNATFIRLNKQTGKVVSKKKLDSSYSLWSATMYIDGDGNLYAIGYYGSEIIKCTKNGVVKWSHRIINSNYYWPYKIKLSGKKLTVFFDGDSNYKKIILNTKNGKIISYK